MLTYGEGLVTGLILGFVITVLLLVYFDPVEDKLEERARGLNLMEYHYEVDDFTLKDSLCVTKPDIHYLIYGNYDDYK